jgi:hypothetical protein
MRQQKPVFTLFPPNQNREGIQTQPFSDEKHGFSQLVPSKPKIQSSITPEYLPTGALTHAISPSQNQQVNPCGFNPTVLQTSMDRINCLPHSPVSDIDCGLLHSKEGNIFEQVGLSVSPDWRRGIIPLGASHYPIQTRSKGPIISRCF